MKQGLISPQAFPGPVESYARVDARLQAVHRLTLALREPLLLNEIVLRSTDT